MDQTNTNTEPTFAAYVGFDWADQKHAGALATAEGRRETFELEQTPEALDAWACKLRQRFGGQLIAVCLEQSKGPLIYGLMKYEFIVLYPVNPKQAKRFREAMQPSGAKNDPGDATFILELVLKHRDRLHAWRPDDPQTRLIGQLAEDRRGLVETRTELSNRLKSRLKQYFPLALDILGELTTELAGQFLLRWSSLEELQQEDPEEVAAFYRLQHCYHPKLIAERQQKIAQARPLTNDVAIVQSGRRLVRALAAQLLTLLEPIRQYEQELERLMTQHPDARIFQSLPGAGDALAPRLLAAFGTDRDRLDNAAQMEQISGIAPVTIQSAKPLARSGEDGPATASSARRSMSSPSIP